MQAQKKAYAVGVGSIIFLNLLLFVPEYFVVKSQHDFFPFFPNSHPRGSYDLSLHSLWEYFLQLFFRRYNLDIFRVSYDVLILLVAMFWMKCFFPTRSRATVLLCQASYLCLFSFLVYHASIASILDRHSLVVEDFLLLQSGLDYLVATFGWQVLVLGAVLGAIVCSLIFIVRRLWQTIWQLLPNTASKSMPVLAMFGVLLMGVSFFSWFGVRRDDTTLQLLSKKIVFNGQLTLATLETNQSFPGVSAYQKAMSISLQKKPNIYLYVIESYGMLLFHHHGLARRMQSLLPNVYGQLQAAKAGLRILSHVSLPPVFGGTSWLSTATLLAGTKIASQTHYEIFQDRAGDFPHLIKFLKSNGYRSISIQPGTEERNNFYGFDQVLDRLSLAYKGPAVGWGVIPDAWTLEQARQHDLIGKRQSPFFWHFMSVSTHTPWEVPPTIGLPAGSFASKAGRYDDPLAVGLQPEEIKSYYLTISYEWHVLANYLRQAVDSNFIFVVVGDHQPYIAKDHDQSHQVPIHVFTDLEPISSYFKKLGFTEGLWPHSEPSVFAHEDVYPQLQQALQALSLVP